MNKINFAFLFFLLLMNGSYAQNRNDKQMGAALDELLSAKFKTGAPGCVVLVTRNNKIIYRKAWGNANIELNVAADPEMVFDIASVTKQFTAVAILQLVEQGKIFLQDSIQKYIPGYPSGGYTITIEHLLTHTSGIKDYLQMEMNTPFIERWDFSPKQFIDSFKNHPLEFKPGTRFSYSNSGYYLLGYIIGKVTGKTYQEYMQEQLFKPLEMSHTYFEKDGMVIPGRVYGYRTEGTTVKNSDFWSASIKYAAGGMCANVDDLLKWHKALYANKILKEETFKKAVTPYHLLDGTATRYGYGWYINTYNGIRSVEHPGALPGFQARQIYYPDDQVFVVVLTNNGSASMDELTNRISAVVLNKSLQPDIKIDDQLLEKYFGTYKLSIDTNRVITVFKINDRVVVKLPNNEIVPLLFTSETKFQLKNLLSADCEFIVEKGRVTKIAANQNGYYEWIKTE